MTLRRRWLGLLGLLAYAAGAIAIPALHQRDHRPDHRHRSDGTIEWAPEELRVDEPAAQELVHQAFDVDLVALDLAEVGHFGVAAVECEYARYTLAACDDPAAPPHTFGDELVARTHQHRHRPGFDPTHGAGSREHFGLAFLAPPPSLFCAPPLSVSHLPPRAPAVRSGATLAVAPSARGPPDGARSS